MPFTPSHAVVALPFVRTPLVPAAIAIGAMAPDLPLFVRGLPLSYGRTHDLTWLPVTVLLALLLLLVWRCVLRPAVRELSPAWLARRLPEEWDGGAGVGFAETLGRGDRRLPTTLLVLASLTFGVITHIVWDLFTHEGRAGVELFPALYQQWGPFFGYKWLQYASSAAGLAIIAIWSLVWLSGRDAAPAVRRTLPRAARWGWWASLPVVLAVAAVVGYVVLGPFTDEWNVQHLAYRVLLPACALWGGGSILLALVVQVRRTAPAGKAP
ncbi:DUF4184 family protein [Planococcus sp. APC 4015]|nr:DUF4184 family protein [Planococcus sp. APC 4015]